MENGIKVILRGTGLLLHAPGLMALVSVPICYFFDELYAVWPFLWTAVISLGLGQLLFRVFRGGGETRLSHAMVIAALGWLSISIIGALPFWLVASNLSISPGTPGTVLAFQEPINALFESFSGFTSTGLTMAEDPAALPPSLQWWRSFTEWVGGAGVIVLLLSVIGSTGNIFRLYYSEGRTDRLAPSMSSTVRTIWWIYLGFTVVAVMALLLVGVPWWEALNHGMTGIATGGFDVAGDSLGSYSVAGKLVMVVIMLAGATSFAVHYQVLTKRNISVLWHNAQQRALWFIVLSITGLVILEHLWFRRVPLVVDSLFQVVSALTTTGFGSVDISNWDVPIHMLLTLVMIIGGAAGSTVGGIKLIRLIYLHKGIQWRLQRISLSQHQVMRYTVGNEAISEKQAKNAVEAAGVLAAMWISLIGIGVFALMHILPDTYTLSDVIFEVASAQGNVGLSIGITGRDMPWLAKLILMMHMYVGRLEVMPVVFLLFAVYDMVGRETQRAQRKHILHKTSDSKD